MRWLLLWTVDSHYDDEKLILRMRRRRRMNKWKRVKETRAKQKSDLIVAWTEYEQEQSQAHKTKASENFNTQNFILSVVFSLLCDPECWTFSTCINQSCSPSSFLVALQKSYVQEEYSVSLVWWMTWTYLVV